ncbi:MAG: hypothetical protein FJZ92_07835 [Chloroflexi bacterium]|nr:hypothetical protein [Chloroflexota bacterium]
MPILEIESVLDGSALAADLATRIADAAGAVFDSSPQETWVRLSTLERGRYAENAGGPPAAWAPVFVRLLLARPPEGEARAEQVRALTDAVAAACARAAEHVHVLYEPPGAGRVAFGGRLVDE